MKLLPNNELWKKPSLLFTFAWMNIKIRFKGTHLGLLWTALEPLLYFIFLYFLFESIKISKKEDFAIYLLTGIILYHAFSRGTLTGLSCLRDNNKLLSTLNINREFFPLVAIATTSILMIVETGVYFGLMPFFEFVPSVSIILFPLILVLLLALILGVSYILSIVYIYAKDIQPLWSVVIHAMFFLNPIFWYLDEAGGIALEIQKINPLGQIIELGHQIVFGNIPPINDWLYTTSIVIGILVAGYLIFHKFEKNAMEQM